MRLAPKIFLTAALAIAVLAIAGALSLRAVGRLVAANREIATRTVPALRTAGSARDTVRALQRIEARWAVLGDPGYVALWHEAAARAAGDLDRLAGDLGGEEERRHLAAAAAAFAEYRRTVAAALERPRRPGAGLEPPGGAAAARVEAALDALMGATHARALAAQAEAGRLERRTWTAVAVALVAAVGLALAGAALLAERMTRSLRRLSTATAAVAAGAFGEPIPVQSRDELGELARAFNTMAAELRRMDETKEEFFAALSHELRSPLTSVREAAHLLEERVPGPLNDRQARLVAVVGQSTDRVLGLVNRLLEVARLRAGALALERAPVDLDRVTARAMEELRPRAEEAGVALQRRCVGARFEVEGDAERLVQVVVNLLANALRFTPRGGRVDVRLADAGPEVEIQVEDTGAGIPPEALPRIFDAYRQAHRGRGGTGLGLAIVRGVVEAHGGRVTAESQEGKGSRFTVLLPRGEAA